MQSVGVFHPGTQHSWQTARAFQDGDMLQWYATSLFFNDRKWPYQISRWLPKPMARKVTEEFNRFHHPHIQTRFVRDYWTFELMFRVAARAGLKGLKGRLNRASDAYLARRVSALTRQERVNLLWGYDGCSLEAFQSAKPQGTKLVLDKTIGDWRAYDAIMAKAREDYREFFIPGEKKVSSEVIARQDEEYSLADRIVVGSAFCGNTIRSVRQDVGDKIKVVPYCFDDVFFGCEQKETSERTDNPVRFLFVGGACARKGIHLVLKAFERIPPEAASLTILGSLQIPKETFARYADRVTLEPSVSRRKVVDYMRNADCLVFPSYFEGSAISVYEALASGLAVIATENAGVDIDSTVGRIVPVGCERALYDALMSAIDDRQKLSSWKNAAREFSKRLNYANYSDNVRGVAQNLLMEA